MIALLRRSALIALVASAPLFVPSDGVAQQLDAPVPRSLATRAELEALAAQLERDGRGAESREVRLRLAEGDFRPGDRIAVQIALDTLFRDTLTVTPQRTLVLPLVDPLSLAGVLRSEVQERLRQHVAQYVREPRVAAVPLIRVGILGEVTRPGFYPVPADMISSDLLMVAGGPTAGADLRKMVAMRDGAELKSREEMQRALGTGASLDQMNLRNGDQVVVRPRSQGANLTTILGVVGALTGIATAVVLIAQ